MKRVHVPDVMATGCFESYRITRILGDDDEHGVGFAVQYVSADMDIFNIYQQQHAKRLQQEHSDRYANQYVSFRTLMKISKSPAPFFGRISWPENRLKFM